MPASLCVVLGDQTMKINELLIENTEQLDEKLPGEKGAFATAMGRYTGIGGASNLKRIRQISDTYYKEWISVVPVLQRSGKLGIPTDTDLYKENLKAFLVNKLKLNPSTDSEIINKLDNDIGPIPTKASIKKATEAAISTKMTAFSKPTKTDKTDMIGKLKTAKPSLTPAQQASAKIAGLKGP